MKKLCFIFSFVIATISAYSQAILTIDSAIGITLKNNYNILIAQNNSKVASNNHAPGIAGMLPDVGINAGYSGSDQNINQKFSSGLELTKKGVLSSTINPSLGLTWTLFDGMKMFINYNELGLLKDEGITQVKSSIQDNIAAVIEAYYNIVQQKQLLDVYDSNLVYYKEEMDIANEQYQIGTGSKLNYLQAEVSYNAQNSAYLKQKITVDNAIISLNQLLELPVETTYNVRNDINIGREMNFDSLKAATNAQNPSLLVAKMGMDVAEDNVKLTNAMRLPSINLGLNYGLATTQSNGGFSLLNQSLGLTGGLTLTWTIFNGSIINIQHENAELASLNAKFQYDFTTLQVNATLLETYKQYEINLKILAMDEANFLVAKENLNVALEQFRIGTANIVQLQQAQASFAAAGGQVVSDRYNTKVSETQLLQLASLLVK